MPGPWERFAAPAETIDAPAPPKPWEKFGAPGEKQDGPWSKFGAADKTAEKPDVRFPDWLRSQVAEKPGDTVGSVLPIARDQEGHSRLALPGIARSMVRGAADLMEGARGELDPGKLAGEGLSEDALGALMVMPAGGRLPSPKAVNAGRAGAAAADAATAERAAAAEAEAAQRAAAEAQAREAAKAGKQQQTADLAKAARETTQAPSFTPDHLGPELTGQVNLKRFRQGMAATDRFTLEDLQRAGLDQKQIEQLTIAQRPAAARLQGPLETPPAAPEVPPAAAAKPEPVPGFTQPSPESPVAQKPNLLEPRKFEDQLFALETNRVADTLEAKQRLKTLPPDIPPATWEKLYHFEENPTGVPLTAGEKALYDQHIAPMKAEADRLFGELEGYGVPVESEGYTPRYVSGRTRSLGEVLDQWKQGVEAKFGGASGRSLKKTTDSQKSRRFYNAVNPETGEKTVVYVAPDRNVLAFDGKGGSDRFGSFKAGQKIEPGSKMIRDGATWKLEQATTQEIEQTAGIQYSKNVMANRLDNLTKLQSAVRNARFLEGVKQSPDWSKIATKVTEVASPPKTGSRQWRVPKSMQFRDYYMEPRIADALDDFLGGMKDMDGLRSGIDKVGSVIKGSIFFNPLPHLANVFNHYVVSKGAVGMARDLTVGAPKQFNAGIRAVRAVATQNEDFIQALREGASLPYGRMMTRDLHQTLIKALGDDVVKNPKQWDTIAKAFGYANPVEWVKGVYRMSSKALWAGGDVLNMMRIFEIMETKGETMAKAIRHSETHMPNYRVPGQVAGSRSVAQTLQSPLLTMFGRYQYNRLASYGAMTKELVSKGVPPKDRAEALDQLAMLGFYTFGVYQAYDWIAQQLTGNENASVTRAGASHIPTMIGEIAGGEKSISQGLQSTFTPGPLVSALPEVAFGNYMWNGKPIARMDDLRRGDEQFLYDIERYIGSKISPLGMAGDVIEGRKGGGQTAWAQLGIRSPTDQQVAAKKKYQANDTKNAIKRDAKERAKREAGE